MVLCWLKFLIYSVCPWKTHRQPFMHMPVQFCDVRKDIRNPVVAHHTAWGARGLTCTTEMW